MTEHQRQGASPVNRLGEKEKSGDQETGESDEIVCRCKEVSKKTFPEMLKLMLRDLIFWKKTKEHE
jgi:hypothetical protein